MKYSVYILQSDKDGSYYIGQTMDVKKRLLQHNEGSSKYTSRKVPWRIIYTEELESRSEAIKRERFLKRQRNSSFYKNLKDKWSGSSVG